MRKNSAKYQLYRNLHKNCFSIRYKGKVIKHSNIVILNNVEFKVSEKGRKKVLKEKRKNVHAFLSAENFQELNELNININKLKEIYYNPYTTENFILKNEKKTIFYAKTVLAYNNKIYLLEN